MIVTVMEKMYKIEFEYDRDEQDRPIITHAMVLNEHRHVVGKVGEAICHDLDNPVKEVGRKLALARAIHDLPLEERKIVWKEYFSR